MEQGEAFVEMELHQAWASMAKSGPKHQHRAFASSSPAMVSKDESIRSGPESEQNPDFFIYYTTILNPGNRQPFANSYELFYMYCIHMGLRWLHFWYQIESLWLIVLVLMKLVVLSLKFYRKNCSSVALLNGISGICIHMTPYSEYEYGSSLFVTMKIATHGYNLIPFCGSCIGWG